MKHAALVVSMAMLVTAVGAEGSADNPLAEVFPYGVYVGGNNPEWADDVGGREGRREAIDRTAADLAAHHMNCVWLSNLSWDNLDLWLAAGRQYGIRVIPQAGGPPGFVRAQWFEDREDFANRVEPFYRKLAHQYEADEALLAWSLTEENAPNPWFYQAVGDLTRKMQGWDPRHPMITMDNGAAAAWMNARIVRPKAFTRDVYVFFADGLNGPYQPIGFRSLLTRECTIFNEIAQASDAVYWIMGQGMAITTRTAAGERVSWRYPTPAETRWQVWTSVQHGATGFFYFMYRGPSHPSSTGEFIEGLRGPRGAETAQYQTAAEVGRSLEALAPVLLQLRVAKPHENVVYWENSPVTGRTLVHRRTGRRFVAVVNNDCERIQPVGIELGYFVKMLAEDDRLFDLRTGVRYDYQSIKLTTLLPGDGTVYFVGTEAEWKRFSTDRQQAVETDRQQAVE